MYRDATASIGMHQDIILDWIKRQALMLTPIAPHFAEYLWQEVLKQPTSVQNELFPKPSAPVDKALSAAQKYVNQVSSNVASTETAQMKKKAKGKGVAYDPKQPKKLAIYVALKYPGWQEKYIDLVREAFDAVSLSVNIKAVTPKIEKAEMKKAMPFVQGLSKRLQAEKPEAVFDRKLPFDEVETLRNVVPQLKKLTGAQVVEVVVVEEGVKTGKRVVGEKEGETVDVLPPGADSAVPGEPKLEFVNI